MKTLLSNICNQHKAEVEEKREHLEESHPKESRQKESRQKESHPKEEKEQLKKGDKKEVVSLLHYSLKLI